MSQVNAGLSPLGRRRMPSTASFHSLWRCEAFSEVLAIAPFQRWRTILKGRSRSESLRQGYITRPSRGQLEAM